MADAAGEENAVNEIAGMSVEDFPPATPQLCADGWPEPVRASDLCANPPPTPAVLIDGVLYRGGTMLISGPSKAHKTFTLIDAACAIADGRPWLGFMTKLAPVLMLNLELQDFATANRIEKICDAHGTKPPKELHVWNLRGHSVSIVELAARLPDKIKSIGAGLVVIDPHYKVNSASGGEENSNDSQGQLLCALEKHCSLNGSALALSHHFAKGDASQKNAIDRASGAGVFSRWGDVAATITPHEEPDAMTVEMALRNFAPVHPFAVRWQYPLWVRDDQLDPAKLKRGGAPKKHSADDAVKSLEGLMTSTEWQKASGVPDSSFRRRRDELLDAGRVERIGIHYRRK